MTTLPLARCSLPIKLEDRPARLMRASCLTIRDKDKAARPLIFNRAQQYITRSWRPREDAIGKVRALILKGRQQGCSTYVAGRFYHQTTHEHGTKAYILTHEDPATQNLFNIVKRYHDNCPESFAHPRAPPTQRSSSSTARLRLQGWYRRHQGHRPLGDHSVFPRIGSRPFGLTQTRTLLACCRPSLMRRDRSHP